MASKTFPYYRLPPNTHKPYIGLRLSSPKTHKILPQEVIALVDSGADVCFCSEDLVAFLGEMVTKEKDKKYETFTTANGGKFRAYKISLKVHVCGNPYKAAFYVSDELPHEVPIILGQVGFFNHFEVKFDLRNKKITLTT